MASSTNLTFFTGQHCISLDKEQLTPVDGGPTLLLGSLQVSWHFVNFEGKVDEANLVSFLGRTPIFGS